MSIQRASMTAAGAAGRSLHGAVGHAAVILALGDRVPALVLVTGNVGRTGGVLRVEGVEALLQPLVAELADVDGAADGAPAANAATCSASRLKSRGHHRAAGPAPS
jgi:hypothetical protein